MKPVRVEKKEAGKAMVFALFLAAIITLFRFTPVREYISPDYLQGLVNSFAPWGPLAFVPLYTGGICLFLPATLFGILTGGFVLTFFSATLAEVWRSGDWRQPASGKAAFSLALFTASFFIPALIRKIKPESAG